MNKYKIQIIACKGLQQMKISEEIIESETIPTTIEIGKLKDFEPLDRETRLGAWIFEVEETE